VQANTNVLRIGDAIHIDLMLGNHGNSHRDFKLASKIDAESAILAVTGPDGKSIDLKPGQDISPPDLAELLVDAGFAREDPADEHGEFAVRGGILDVFSWQAPAPKIRHSQSPLTRKSAVPA
jgi:transcription-repair coupling factor (superfamily II helicase)